MNSLTFKGTWIEVQGGMKKRYCVLRDDDIVYVDGQQDMMLGRVQKTLGKLQDEARHKFCRYLDCGILARAFARLRCRH